MFLVEVKTTFHEKQEVENAIGGKMIWQAAVLTTLAAITKVRISRPVLNN